MVLKSQDEHLAASELEKTLQDTVRHKKKYLESEKKIRKTLTRFLRSGTMQKNRTFSSKYSP